jgi:DNA polymerase-3 subunit alpha
MASLLTISGDKKDKEKDPKSILYMHECEEMGIRILPPDINESMDDWTPIPNHDPNQTGLGHIRYGIASIAGVSAKDLEIIKNHRPFTSFSDFLDKNMTMKLNKTKVVALIKSGCFDRFNGPKRNELLRQYYDYRGDTAIMQQIPGKTLKRDIIAYEREVLNMSVSVKSKWEMVADETEGCTVTAVIKELNPFKAKGTGKEHLKMIIETAEDEIQTLVFNKTYMKEIDNLKIGVKLRITGNKSGTDLIANRIVYLTKENEQFDFVTNDQYEVAN